MEVLRATPEHEAQILALAARTLGWSDDDRFAALYRWKHDEGPFGPSPRWVAVADGRVVGFRVFLPWRFRRGAETATAVRAVDTATDPDHQGRGIFRTLTMTAIEELRDQGVGFVFNTPNDQSRPGYTKMGWVELGRPPVAVAVAPRMGSMARTARARTAAELWSRPCDLGRPAGPAFADAVLAARFAPAGERWATDRTADFLRWRFGLADLGYRLVRDADLGGGRGRPGEGAAVVFRLRRRGPAVEAVMATTTVASPARRRLVRAILRATGADHALVAADRRVDLTPAVALAALSPRLAGRAVTRDPPVLSDLALDVGDLELF